jgi:rhamnopyranosyl-N-acetylglucosaminyl-diphospho-decaprenol beta-1,3/1,4-galactofuranosyltransferase
MGLTIATIVCAYNESRLLAGCLYSLRAQTRPPDDILVINNASTDETSAVARAVPGVRLLVGVVTSIGGQGSVRRGRGLAA